MMIRQAWLVGILVAAGTTQSVASDHIFATRDLYHLAYDADGNWIFPGNICFGRIDTVKHDYRMLTDFHYFIEHEFDEQIKTIATPPIIAGGSVAEPSIVHPTPEPASWLLATLAGLGLLAMRVRSKR